MKVADRNSLPAYTTWFVVFLDNAGAAFFQYFGKGGFVITRKTELILLSLVQFIFSVSGAAGAGIEEDSGIWGGTIARGSFGVISPNLRGYLWWLEG
jgi:hypothetical protein